MVRLRSRAFWQPPLYPYVLGIIKTLAPESFFYAIRWFQVILGALTCGLIYTLGKYWFTKKIALIAGFAACFYAPLIFFDGEVLPASLATFLDLLGLLLLVRSLKNNNKWDIFLAGLVFGLASLTVASVLSFVIAATIWLVWQQRSFRLAGIFVFGIFLVIFPITLRNYTIGNDKVLISYNSGVNFYIGNNATYAQTLKTRPGWEWDDLIGEPQTQGITVASSKSAFFWHKAWTFISNQPIAYLRLITTKSLQFFNGNEIGRNQDIYYWRNYSNLLSATLWKWGIAFPFGLVSPLALMGLFLAIRHQKLNLNTLFVLAYSIGIIAFFPVARYRVPLLPLFLLLATYSGSWLWTRFKSGQNRQTISTVVLLIIMGIVANHGIGKMQMTGDAEIHYNLGQAYASKRQLDKAQQAYARSVTQDSTYWQAWLNLASVTALQGDMATADIIFQRITQVRPDQPEVWVNQAHSSRGLGKLNNAVRAYEQSLLINPYQPRIYTELLQLHFQRGALNEAQKLLDKVLALYPNDQQKLLSLYKNMQRQFTSPQQ